MLTLDIDITLSRACVVSCCASDFAMKQRLKKSEESRKVCCSEAPNKPNVDKTVKVVQKIKLKDYKITYRAPDKECKYC